MSRRSSDHRRDRPWIRGLGDLHGYVADSVKPDDLKISAQSAFGKVSQEHRLRMRNSSAAWSAPVDRYRPTSEQAERRAAPVR
jgi:hypothetical protein